MTYHAHMRDLPSKQMVMKIEETDLPLRREKLTKQTDGHKDETERHEAKDQSDIGGEESGKVERIRDRINPLLVQTKQVLHCFC